ncbi:MAG: hypothetical protein WKG03_06425, partial [Telluria sp.]
MTEASEKPAAAPKSRRDPTAFIWVFGIVLPVIAIAFESITGLCRGIFFDPLPTLFHTAMFATIPLANVRLAHALHHKQAQLPGPWAWLHAFSLGVAIVYSVVFLPLTPIAVLGVIFFGLGLLGLAPLFAVSCAIWGRRALQARSGRAPVPLRYGVGLAIALFVAIDLPSTMTGIGLRMATAQAPETRLRGIKLLRAVGSEEALLRRCYDQSGTGTDMLGFLIGIGHTAQSGQVRAIFYQVTGEPFNSRPSPVNQRRGYDFDDMFDN